MALISRSMAALMAICMLLMTHAPAHAGSPGWAWRVAIRISNPAGQELRSYPVRLVLDASRFDFSKAQPMLTDLRFTEADGVKFLSHWLESFDGAQAVIWVNVALLPSTGTSIFLYFGNPDAGDESSGYRTFDFFDDFNRSGPGYFALGPPTTISVQDRDWETQAPHTLSVVALNRGGYRYWGYYGLADCGGIGLLRSNDLVRWDKVPAPLLTGDGERWPSAHLNGDTLYLVYDRDHCGTSHVVMRSSTDGSTFDPTYTVLVAQEGNGVRNQNPNLFFDPRGKRYYLYWYRGGDALGFWQIKVRHSATLAGLADPASERVLLETPYTLAAPHMMLRDGVYFLSTEVNENAWKTKIYSGATPLGPFSAIAGDIVLSNNEACWFQHVFEGALHGYYCKDTRGDGKGWVLQHRIGDLSRRVMTRTLDTTFWEVLGGDWRIVEDKGENVLLGSPGARLRAAIPAGIDKVIEATRGADGVQAMDGRLLLTGAESRSFDNVRIRKRIVPEPLATLAHGGAAERQRHPSQGWFDVSTRVLRATGPAEIDTLAVLAGPLSLLALASVILTVSTRRQTQR